MQPAFMTISKDYFVRPHIRFKTFQFARHENSSNHCQRQNVNSRQEFDVPKDGSLVIMP